MSNPNFLILYVTDIAASAKFYASVLDKQPIEASPGFAMFALPSGVMLGLWANQGVKPAATAPGGSELAFRVTDKDAVNALHVNWKKVGLEVIQAPTQLDFGYTFVATDPDGHRLRVFAPPQQ